MQLGDRIDELIGTMFLHLGEVSHPSIVVQSIDEEQPILVVPVSRPYLISTLYNERLLSEQWVYTSMSGSDRGY